MRYIIILGLFFMLISPVYAFDFISPVENNSIQDRLVYNISPIVNGSILMNINNSLVGWWRLDGSSGTIVEDYSGRGFQP